MERRSAPSVPGRGFAFFLAALLSASEGAAEEFRFEVTSAVSAPGGQADLFLVSSHARPLYGLQASVYFPESVSVLAVDRDGCPDVCSSQVFIDSRGAGCVGLGIILDMGQSDVTLPPSSGMRAAHLRVEAAGDLPLGAVLPIDLRDGCSGIGNRVSVALEPSGSKNMRPALVGGTLEIGGVFLPSAPPPFEIPEKAEKSSPVPVKFLEARLEPLCEVEVRRPGADCPEAVLSLEDDSIPASAFGAAGRYAVRLRLGNQAGWGPWSDAVEIEILESVRFRRADSNGDGKVDISDPIATLSWLFLGAERLPCTAAGNSNGDAKVDISDGVYTLNFLFLGGTAPPEPFPDCGFPPSGSDELAVLGCEDPGPCGGG
ncbi:MAG: hypothetical protein ACUVYA_20790 [Planctomycetota bacterium]